MTRSTELSGFFKKSVSIFLLLYLLFTAAAFSLAAEKPVPKRVLVIYSYHEGLPWERIIDDSLRATFVSKSTEPIELNVEHADLIRYPGDAYLQNFVDLLRRKYSHPKMDVVIGVDDEAADILLKYGEGLFPGLPVVFVTADRKTLQRDSLKPNMTSLLWGLDIQGTVDLICKVLPKTRQIFIISGSSLIGRAVQKKAREVLHGYTKRLEINYLAEITQKDLMDKVGQLPERSVIFYLLFSRDSEGETFVPREIMSDISQKTNVPMFGIVDTYLGFGIMGGSLLSAEVQGKRCAEIALQILGGQSPTETSPEQTLNQLMFDWRQLKRWSIDEDRLPAGSIVRYREPSIWVDHKPEIVGIIAFIFIESFLIIILWIQITRRRKAEIKTRKSEVMYRTVADYTYAWEYWANFDGTFYYVSPSCERISGYTSQEFMDNPSLIREIIVPEDREIWDKHYLNSREELSKQEFEFRIQRLDGEIRWIDHICQPAYDDQGNHVGFRAGNRDTTDHKRADEAIQESEERYALAVKGSTDGLWDSHILSGKVLFSDRFKELIGYSPDEFPDTFDSFRDHLHPEDRDATLKAIEQHHQERVPYDVEYRLRTKQGEYRWFHSRGQAIWDEHGKAFRMAGSIQDINERKQMEKKTQSLQEELAHALRVLSMGEIAASLAHEINQPLTAIRSYAQAAQRLLAHDTPDLDEVGKILTGIVAGNRRAEKVIQRIRILMKNEHMEGSRIDVKKFIKEVVSFVRRNAEEHKISLRLDLDAELPQIFGDRVQLQQVVLNLIINGLEAISAAGEDGLRELVVRASEDEPDVVTISVRDSGIGIDEENKDRMFDSFFSTKSKGLGMGLSISRSIIEEHGGRMWVTQNPVQGATFFFTVPIHKEDLR